MSSLRLSVEGEDPVQRLADLADWLRHEPGLRGLVVPEAVPPGPGELGSVTDALVVAVGSGGALTALATSLRAFLAQPRRSDLRIVVRAPDGSSVEVDAKRVDDVAALLHETLRQSE